MAHMTECSCQWCKKPFMARTADVNRGWAKFCSKPCKAAEQEKRTGQNRAFHERKQSDDADAMHESAMESATAGWYEGGWLNHGDE